MRRPRGLSTRLLVAIVLLATLHVAVFTVLLTALHEQQVSDRKAANAGNVTIAAADAHDALVQLQEAERGVAIAGARPAFVRAWDRSAAVLRVRASQLAHEGRVAGTPSAVTLGARAHAYLDRVSVPLVALAQRRPALARVRIAAGRERTGQALGERLTALRLRERAARQARRDHAAALVRLAWIAGAVGILATFVCALGFLAYVRRALLVPLRRVGDAARALAGGDLAARVAVPGEGTGEVSELARTFDQMAASLQESRTALERQNHELASQTAELVAAARSAREAERAKDEFFALVSHELRTPLTAILGYVELLLGEDGNGHEDERRHLEIVERNAQRLMRLVGDLLFAAQVETGTLLFDPGEVDLAQLVRDAVALACPQAEQAGIALETRIAAIEPCVGDRDRLAQVLDNLISNALKFTPGGGRVTVGLEARDGRAQLTVADTGIGVPPDELPHLFDRFYRASNATARAVPGAGLGLTIVRAIVEGHGGTVRVRSTSERGTTFAVLLPLQPAALTAPPAPSAYSAGGR